VIPEVLGALAIVGILLVVGLVAVNAYFDERGRQ
jgi:hypothetical protein